MVIEPLKQEISFEDTDHGVDLAWERAKRRFTSNQRRQRERHSRHADGNLRYKHALPSSVDRRIRRKGKDEVVAKQLAMLMGESYDLPLQKRGRKKGYKVPCAESAGPAPAECE